MTKKLFGTFLVVALFMSVLSAAGAAEPTVSLSDMPTIGSNSDDVPHPLGQEQRALKEQAMEQVAYGKATGGAVVQVAHGQFVELEREGEDSIWTVLSEFGPLDSPIGILQSGMPGPLHNTIPEPDRGVDNSTIWAPDFSESYFEDLLFDDGPGVNSMRNWYIEQSSNRYTVNGDVTDWAEVPYNTAHYGRDWCGGIVCSTTWWFVEDSVNAWYDQQISDGMTPAQIGDYLEQFDVWDRYDYDGDGNFDEPDGYIDHFQSVHAGEGQEAGGGAYGSDAIWSHRWYANFPDIGSTGPGFNMAGGVQVGSSDFWIGDYTIEPENGGVGVFAHEFGHDLGLPDLYDTSGNTGGAENSTGFWTMMSSGSWLNQGEPDIGSVPGHFGAWEKFQLGWLNYEVASAGAKSQHKLGPAETNTKQAQGLFVVLPDKEVTETIGDPYAGEYFYYSGAGNDLDNVMYRAFDLGAGSTLTAQVNFDIEVDWDYAYVVVSTDGGATWTGVPTDFSTNSDPNGQNFGNGITGSSGGWTLLTANLSAYTGPTLVGFRYWTDVAAVNPGFMADEVTVTGFPTDGAETDTGWTYAPVGGFRVTDGTETGYYFNAYVAEFRQYRGYDDGLRTGPYNFGFLDDPSLGNWVEHFPYQDGLLISYWDTSFADNNVGDHCLGTNPRCGGLILPIDAHPEVMYDGNGAVWRNRIQSYDSTFSKDATDSITLHSSSTPSTHASQNGASVFDDRESYWSDVNPTGSVIVPITGTQIRIKSVSAQGSFMQVEVRPAK
jgi:immune inhibitor A